MPPDPAARAPVPRAWRIVLLVLAAGAVAVVATGVATRASQASRLKERAESHARRTVAVVAPGKGGDNATLELPARIEANARAPIFSRVSGYVKSWHADIGAPVKAGQLLALLETPDLDQQLAQARAELATAHANEALAATTARRWESLATANVVSRQGVDEKLADLSAKRSVANAVQANVERLEATKAFARIVAPFDGVVTARSTDVGALVNGGSAQGSELFVVSDTRKLRVYVSVPQAWVAAVPRGTVASLLVPERPGQPHAATVQGLAQAINAASGAMLVQLSVDNAGAELLPGGFARVRFPLPAAPGTLTIPPSALMFDKAGLRVATVDAAGKVRLKPVTVARDRGSVIEIASGLAESDRVIESPPDGIAEGDAVSVAGKQG